MTPTATTRPNPRPTATQSHRGEVRPRDPLYRSRVAPPPHAKNTPTETNPTATNPHPPNLHTTPRAASEDPLESAR